MSGSRARFTLVIGVGLLSIAGCQDKQRDAAPKAEVAPAERYHTRGKIVAMTAEEIDLHHERIPAIRGYDGAIKPMESMTMPFGRNGTSFAGLAARDLVDIQFTVHFDSDPTLRLVAITELPADTKLELP